MSAHAADSAPSPTHSLCPDRGPGAVAQGDSRLCRARNRSQCHALGRSQRISATRWCRSWAQMGLMGVIFPVELGGRRSRLRRLRDRGGRAFGCRWLHWHHRRVAQLALHQPHFSRWQRGAKAQVHSPARLRQMAWRLGIDRAWFRLRRRKRPHHCRTQRRPLGAEREQDIHYQRPLRRCRL